MKKIDIHHHLIEEKGYVDNLLRAMDKFEIEKSSLIGLGSLFKGLFLKGVHDGSCADDKTVKKTFSKYPDRFFGQGFIRLGADNASKVDKFYEEGFKGLKFHIPKKRYDSEEYFPVFEKAQKYNMPCLFHTGIVTLPTPCPEQRISSFNMEPIHLEAIAQNFPSLKIIIAHLGVQSNITALNLIRIIPNIYADLSGGIPGWRANLSNDEWKKYLWFEHASEKILFGSDGHYSEFSDDLMIYDNILNSAELDMLKKRNVYYNNAKDLFGI